MISILEIFDKNLMSTILLFKFQGTKEHREWWQWCTKHQCQKWL